MTKKQLSEAHKKAISEARKGFRMSSDQKKLLSDIHQGRKKAPRSEEYRKNISLALKQGPGRLGRIKKTTEKLKGRALSEEHKRAISLANTNNPLVQAMNAENWRGGQTGQRFAEILCPAGFIPEHRVYWGG